MLTLVLGGARSGKTRYAQQLAEASGLPVCYVATAEAKDPEMEARIARHQEDRPKHWLTREEPLHPEQTWDSAPCVLVDCLTLWLSNWLCQDHEEKFQNARDQLLTAAKTAAASPSRHIILVSNEVGLGVIPMGELTRRFVDEAGWLNQEIAKVANHVTLISAGIPLQLKGASND